MHFAASLVLLTPSLPLAPNQAPSFGESAAAGSDWACPQCTVRNPNANSVCSVCGYKNANVPGMYFQSRALFQSIPLPLPLVSSNVSPLFNKYFLWSRCQRPSRRCASAGAFPLELRALHRVQSRDQLRVLCVREQAGRRCAAAPAGICRLELLFLHRSEP